MIRKLIPIALIGLVGIGWMATTSSAQTPPAESASARASGLHCQANEPVLTAIVEPAVGEAASSSPEEALDALLADAFPGTQAQRDKFERHDEAAGAARFDFVNGGKKQMVVLTREVGDEWTVAMYTLCSLTLPRGR